MAEFLLELFSEESPARMQAAAARDLERLFRDHLAKGDLAATSLRTFGGPRRLTLVADGLPLAQADRTEERKGPRVGAPEAALQGFLRSTGLAQADLVERDGVWFASIAKLGRPTPQILAEAVETIVRTFPWPKSMTWGAGKLRWVRPLKSILCVFDGEIVPLTIDGLEAGDRTEGHRVMGEGRSFAARTFADYARGLADHYVVLEADERKRRIQDGARSVCEGRGLQLVEDEALLDEVAGLAEWPTPVLGNMDPSFLDLPPEVIRTSMAVHQRYFAVRAEAGGKLAPHFVVVANIEASDGGALVAAGNARVLSARLSDAKFFWSEDVASGFEPWLRKLEGVTFHAKLGTMAQRVSRIVALARLLAPMLGADVRAAERAALLAKADLASHMVGEFPELQGIMGGYYGRAFGEADDIVGAIATHYRPLGSSDTPPMAPVAAAVALADKIDTLCSFESIGERATGSRDPYALRRAALGVIRTLLQNGDRVPLRLVLDTALETVAGQLTDASGDVLRRRAAQSGLVDELGIGEQVEEIAQELEGDTANSEFVQVDSRIETLLAFFADRLKVLLRDQGQRHDLVDAIFALGDDDIVRVVARVEALGAFLATEDGANLLAGYRRASNLVKAETAKGGVSSGDPRRMESAAPAELALFDALQTVALQLETALVAEDFSGAMRSLAALRGPVDAFFQDVLVNSPVPAERENRLRLLMQVRDAMEQVADFSLVTG